MAIERMSLVSIVGGIKKVNRTLMRCFESECFHIIESSHGSDISTAGVGFKTLKDRNPYAPLVKRAAALAEGLEIKIEQKEYEEIDFAVSVDFAHYFTEIETVYNDFFKRLQETKSMLEQHKRALTYVEHMEGLTSDFEKIFALEYIKVRFGRLPADSFKKLRFFEHMNFMFFPFEEYENYVWGVYFAAAEEGVVVDDLFNSIYFERVRIPDYVKGTAEDAKSYIENLMKRETEEIEKLNHLIKELSKNTEEKFLKVFSKLNALNTSFELRGKVSVINSRFFLLGYVPAKKARKFIDIIEEEESVTAQIMPDADPMTVPPVKLKNNRVFRPFEMFVSMYGLPEYGKVDPTPFVAVTFMLLYGIMFSDLGQGLFLSLLGFLLYKIKKVKLGPVMVRLGFSSAVFGYFFGSVFGNEELITPVFAKKEIYSLAGLEHAPHNIFEVSSLLMIASIAVGVIIILIAMIFNVIVSARSNNIEAGVFGTNGINGFMLYSALIIGAGMTFGLGVNLFTPVYVTGFIIIPVLILFFKKQLADLFHLKDKNNGSAKQRKTAGTFIIEGVMEIFESGLTYVTNTMSFLRIGGFVLSHAGLMLVVNILAEKAGSVGSAGWIIAMVAGNLFVIGLEGFLVGIQVLRLEFYEIFSRFYKSGGTPFHPMATEMTVDS